MTKKIVFKSCYPWFFEVAPKPIPASKNLPEWLKKMSPYMATENNPLGNSLSVINRTANVSGKKCFPMLDALSSGYLIPLWSDVYVDATSETTPPAITWRVSRPVFEMHGDQTEGVEAPKDFHMQPFKYLNYWRIITPPGYSILVTQPFGFRNTNLQAIPAVIDTDKSNLQILFPLWIKKGFKGVIEKGTPIAQVTPFKRDNWEAEYSTYSDDTEYRNLEDAHFGGNLINNYMRREWSKKTYE
jgi:hypothetical protein